MPFLSWKKVDKCKPIAIVRGDANAVKNKKFVYVCEGKPADELPGELDEHDVMVRLKGYRTKEKREFYELFVKCARENVDPDDLPTEDKHLKQVYEECLKVARNTFKAPEGCHFEYMPMVPEMGKGATRECIFVTGCSGSGKSWFTKTYAENYTRLHKGKNSVYLVSSLTEDTSLDSAKCKIKRIDLEKLVDDPIDLNDGDLDNSLLIFDDWDTVENEKGKEGRPYKDVLWKLLNDALTMGRHNNLTVICISHHNTLGQKGRLIVTECNTYTVYPHGTSAQALKYLLHDKVGIPRKEIERMGELGRWITVTKTFPKFLVSEHVCKLL